MAEANSFLFASPHALPACRKHGVGILLPTLRVNILLGTQSVQHYNDMNLITLVTINNTKKKTLLHYFQYSQFFQPDGA
jgi:hypothetical protein